MAGESRQDFDLRKLVPEEEARKTFAKVFDKGTIKAVHRLSTKGYFHVLEHVVSTGKEAHVFHARDSAGNSRAVKIYKIETSDFKKMHIYLKGDRRFSKVKKSRRSIVFAWARKEFKNLLLMTETGVRCPMPIAFYENVLVMEFVGKGERAAPTMKELAPKNLKKAYETIVEWLAGLLFKAELVHADFSEYNVLNNGEELVLIDAGQAVLTSHPEAEAFFERDLKNLANYFTKKGLKKEPGQMKQDVKALKGKN